MPSSILASKILWNPYVDLLHKWRNKDYHILLCPVPKPQRWRMIDLWRRQWIPHLKNKYKTIKRKLVSPMLRHEWLNESNTNVSSVSVSAKLGTMDPYQMGFPTAYAGSFPLAHIGKWCVNSFPWHRNTVKHMAWGWKEIYSNLAMEWASPARSGMLGQEPHPRMRQPVFFICD